MDAVSHGCRIMYTAQAACGMQDESQAFAVPLPSTAASLSEGWECPGRMPSFSLVSRNSIREKEKEKKKGKWAIERAHLEHGNVTYIQRERDLRRSMQIAVSLLKRGDPPPLICSVVSPPYIYIFPLSLWIYL